MSPDVYSLNSNVSVSISGRELKVGQTAHRTKFKASVMLFHRTDVLQTIVLLLMISVTPRLIELKIRSSNLSLFSHIALNCVSYLHLRFFTNITRLVSDFCDFYLLDFFLNPPVCFWPVGRQWFSFSILSDKPRFLTAQLYHTLYVYLDFPIAVCRWCIREHFPFGTW